MVAATKEFSDEVLAEAAARLDPNSFAEHCGLSSPTGPFYRTRLNDYLGRIIADAVGTGGARVIVNVGPGQGKSELCDFATPTWYLDNFPNRRIILATNTDGLATDFGRRVRDEFETNPRLYTKLREDSRAANRWNTMQGGGLKAVGAGNSIMGFRAELIIADDPHGGWVEAQSPAERAAVIAWFTGTLCTRLEPHGSIVLVMQRLHPLDLTGHLVASGDHGPWKVVTLPTFAGKNDPMGRVPGELVCPERWSLPEMEQKRATTPKDQWSAMHDQDPQAGNVDRAYVNFRVSEHVSMAVSLRDDLPLQLAWDFNMNPGTHCLVGQYDSRLDLFTTRHEVWAERGRTPDILKLLLHILRPMGRRWPRVDVFGDRSMKTPNTVTSDTDYALIRAGLAELGMPVVMRVPAANPAVKSRLMSVADALRDNAGNVHWKIHPECMRLIVDLNEVRTDLDGQIDKSNDLLTHPSDAEGYRIHAQRPVGDPGAWQRETVATTMTYDDRD